MKKVIHLILIASAFAISQAEAKLNIVATVPDLKWLATEIGGDQADVSSIAKGTQDPHFIEAKPSFMTKMSRADLVLSVGMELEIGYLPPLLQGARNPKVMPGSPGNFVAGSVISPLELPTGKITRAEGDVHPEGNPHFMLDPVRAGQVAVAIAERMGQLDSAHAAQFLEKAKIIQARFQKKLSEWQARVEKSKVKKVVSYHKTLTYFFDRFHIANPAILEPKPGIPPTAGHTMEIIQIIKSESIPLVMIENYFDPTIANRIKESVPSVRIATVPCSVDGAPGINSLDDLYEKLVSTVEGK